MRNTPVAIHTLCPQLLDIPTSRRQFLFPVSSLSGERRTHTGREPLATLGDLDATPRFDKTCSLRLLFRVRRPLKIDKGVMELLSYYMYSFRRNIELIKMCQQVEGYLHVFSRRISSNRYR